MNRMYLTITNLVDQNLVLRTVLLWLLTDTLDTKQNRTNHTHKKGLLERIVEPPFLYVIAWSSTLHWV